MVLHIMESSKGNYRPDDPVTLPNILFFEVYGSGNKSISQLCDSVTLPSLQYLDINWGKGDISDALSALLARSSFPLVSFRYSGVEITDTAVVSFLDRVPTLRDVMLSFREGFKAPLLVELEARSVQITRPFLPNLRYLEFRGNINEDDTLFFLAMRSARSEVCMIHDPAPLLPRGRWNSSL
jgi:hypothetical protein